MEASVTDEMISHRLAIRDVVETWAIARDSGDWDTFRAQWHDDGYMMATWFQGPKDDFIRVSQEGWAKGVNILHFTGGCKITIAGARAIAQTRMTIMQRAEVHGVACDVACTGRFYDFFELRNERWRIVLRQPIYEKDRLDPVDPAATLRLDPELLARFPEGYRHLAYLQVGIGYPVKPDMPGLCGPEVERLYERGAAWLAGEPLLARGASAYPGDDPPNPPNPALRFPPWHRTVGGRRPREPCDRGFAAPPAVARRGSRRCPPRLPLRLPPWPFR
jgi:SnoaL-like domain